MSPSANCSQKSNPINEARLEVWVGAALSDKETLAGGTLAVHKKHSEPCVVGKKALFCSCNQL